MNLGVLVLGLGTLLEQRPDLADAPVKLLAEATWNDTTDIRGLKDAVIIIGAADLEEEATVSVGYAGPLEEGE